MSIISGVPVPQLQESGVRRLRMSYDEWVSMEYEGRSEWVDGEALLMPPVTWRHGEASFVLMAALRRDLSGVFLYADVGLRMPNNRVRAPDLMAATTLTREGYLDEVPILAVEILSPETRQSDLVAKSTEYLSLGIGQYWIVDPRDRCLDVFANRGDAWEPIIHLDENASVGSITVGDHGEVALDLDLVLPT